MRKSPHSMDMNTADSATLRGDTFPKNRAISLPDENPAPIAVPIYKKAVLRDFFTVYFIAKSCAICLNIIYLSTKTDKSLEELKYMYKAVIFDMDGTLLNTLEDLKNTLNYALKTCGYPTHTLEEVRAMVGCGVRTLILSAMPQGTEESYDKVYAAFVEHYVAHSTDTTKIYDGMYELIEELKSLGIKTAIVSNKADIAVQPMTVQYFGDLIDVAIGESESVKVKPCPDGVLKAIDELKVDKADAVYVGDGETDIMTAKNAAIDCISVSYGFRSEEFLIESGATKIAHSVAELRKYLLDK